MHANLRAARDGVLAAARQGAQLIMTPEYVALLDGSGRVMRDNSYPEDEHPALLAFQALARETGAWLLVGSLTVKIDERLGRKKVVRKTFGARNSTARRRSA